MPHQRLQRLRVHAGGVEHLRERVAQRVQADYAALVVDLGDPGGGEVVVEGARLAPVDRLGWTGGVRLSTDLRAAEPPHALRCTSDRKNDTDPVRPARAKFRHPPKLPLRLQ